MIQIKMILEDLTLTATFRQHEDESTVVDIEIIDDLTGTSGKATWTTKQWRAVHLLIANADEESIFTKELYTIAESAFEMIPVECRPIP